MKKIWIAASFVLSASVIEAQQKQGMVIYERTSQVQINFSGMPGGMENQVPRTRKDKFELSFANNQSLWKSAEEENNETTDISGGEGGGMQIRMVMAGSNDVLFNNFETGKRVEKREVMDKSFIIDDSIRSLKWKMTGETKTILNMPCMKATTSNIRTRTMMNMDNGKMERKEVTDTVNIVAWFTTSIPVSAGPAEYQGQLPGLILEMDIKDGTQVFKALAISEKVDVAAIKEPSGKKRYTPEEFKKERDKMMADMNKNSGGNRQFRVTQ